MSMTAGLVGVLMQSSNVRQQYSQWEGPKMLSTVLSKAREGRKGREKTQTGRFQFWFGFSGRWIFNSIAHE